MPRKKPLPTGVSDDYATGLHIRWPGPPDANGRPTTRSATLKGVWDPDEASAIRDRHIEEVTALVARGSHHMTVHDLVVAWKARRLKDFEDMTVAGYGWIFGRMEAINVEIIRARKPVVTPLGEVRLIDLNRPVIRQLLDYLEVSGRKDGMGPLSGSSIRKIAGLLSEVLGWAVDRGWLTANPAHGQRLPSSDPKGARALTTRELKRLIAHITDPVLQAAAITMWAVGLRPSEALALSLPDILLDRRLLLARRVRTGRGTAKRLKDKEPRAVPMPDTLVRFLRTYMASVVERAEEFGEEYRWDRMFLFPQADGRSYTLPQLRKAVHDAAYAARLGVVNPKDARTTWATMSDADAVDEDEVEAVAESLGHASTATTARHYVRPAEQPVPLPKKRQRKVADRMDQRLRYVVDPMLLSPPPDAPDASSNTDKISTDGPEPPLDDTDPPPGLGSLPRPGPRSGPPGSSHGATAAQTPRA
jgi:integrase